MVDADIKSAKYAASQQRRLQSLKEKQELQRQKQQLVSEALKSVDNPNGKSNKRIVFDSDSEGDEVASKKPKLLQKKLFEDSDDEHPDIEKEDGDALITTGRITGRGSDRLMKLEKKFGNDSRFQLDNTYLEDNEKEDNEDVARAQEKERQFRLLSMVVGRDVKPRQEAVAKKSSVRPFHRFDPDNAEHVEWMKNFSKEKAPESDDEEPIPKSSDIVKIVNDESEVKELTKPVVDERRFYEIDQDFAAELRTKLLSGQKETYSFLNAVKKFPDDEDGGMALPDEEKKITPETIAEDQEHLSKKMQKVAQEPCFFFESTDLQLSSKLNSFYSTVEKNARLRKWEIARNSFKALARQVRKRRMRDLDIKKS